MTMPIPRYFDPDPEIPDADLLGYGDIVYDDGSRRYVSNDPEIVTQLEMKPIETQVPNLQQQVPVPELMKQPPPPIQGADGRLFTTDWKDPYNPIKELDPLAGNSLAMPAQTPMGPMGGQQGGMGIQSVGTPVRPDGSPIQTPEQFDALMKQPPPPIQGADGQLYMTDINDPENPIKPYDPNGLQVVGREGALPPDVAQQQLGALEQAQQATLAANEQARAETARIQQEAFAQEMGVNEARKQALQQEQQEQKAKLERWDNEQQQWAEMEIDKSLSGAVGVAGSIFAVLGSALLASTGSDAGGRMIDNSIDRHVRLQLQRRDSMLRIYADRIGDTKQAMHQGKAELYKIAADRAELMTKKTANDVYEAQSPAIIASLREKQVAEMNEAQTASLGKFIERVPPPPAPPDRVSREGYGKASAEQTQAQKDALRALSAIGGKYDPQTGRITNRDEILKRGIRGVGSFDTFMKDLGRLPVVGALPQALDTAITSQEGLDVRYALEALVGAEAKRQNPTGVLSEGDIQRARESLGITSEKGAIDAIERALNAQPQTRAQNVATYGAPAAAAVEGTMGALGQGRQELTAPSQYQQLEPGRAREQIQQERARSQTEPTELKDMSPEQRMAALNEGITALSQDKGIPPEGVAILMAQAGHETNDGKNLPTNNFFGMKSTPRNMARGAGATNLMTTEGAGGSAKRVKQNFATFDSANDAAIDMLSLLERKYPRALEALQAGDVDAYVAALKSGGFFTADESVYANGLRRRL